LVLSSLSSTAYLIAQTVPPCQVPNETLSGGSLS
jgi:hypothetical protein